MNKIDKDIFPEENFAGVSHEKDGGFFGSGRKMRSCIRRDRMHDLLT